MPKLDSWVILSKKRVLQLPVPCCDRCLSTTEELPSLLSGDTLLVLPPSQHTNLHPQALLQPACAAKPLASQQIWLEDMRKTRVLPAAVCGVGLFHPVEGDIQGAGTLKGGLQRHYHQPGSHSDAINRRGDLLYCYKVLSCGFWHALISGPTTTSCVGGICMVVNFSPIPSEGILVRVLCAIPRRLD